MTRRFFEESLTLDVYIIGYKTQGESIILIVKSDGIINFTCIIDCYEYLEINKTHEILESLDISFVDMICWTHPDLDHSLGIDDLLSKYTNEETLVLMPEGLDGRIESYDYNDRVHHTFNLINTNLISRRHDSFKVKSVSDSKNLRLDDYEHKKEGIIYKFDIKSIAPSSELIRKRNQLKTLPIKNNYSIGLHVQFGGLDLLLGGDVENESIRFIETEYIPDSFDMLKTPHHTSRSSDEMLQLLNKSNKTNIVCSTVFRSSNLPDTDLINRYREYSEEFFCTGCIYGQNDNDSYGCIRINYDILNKKSTTYLRGNANLVPQNNI
jgi:beta-lactamase superfamily II metal-dependent hydrolase